MIKMVRVNKARGLFHINSFLENVVKEGILNINLSEGPFCVMERDSTTLFVVDLTKGLNVS